MTPWELAVLETIVAWTKKAWTSCQATLHIKKVSRKSLLLFTNGGSTEKWPRFSIRQAAIYNYLVYALFIYCGRLRAEEWGGEFSIHIWGQAALSFRFLLHRCVDNLVYFPDAGAVLKFRPGGRGQDGDCRLLCRVSEIWAATCTKPFKNLRLKFCPGDKGRMGIIDFCVGWLKFGLLLVQSPSKISEPLATKWLCECYALGRVSQPLWSGDIGRASSFSSWHTKGIVVMRVMKGLARAFTYISPGGTSPMLWHKPRQKRSHKNDWWWVSSSHWPRCLGHEGGFCVVYKHKICDIAHVWSIESQFLLIKITFIQTSIHSKYWQVSTHMPKKTGIGVTFPTPTAPAKHPVMGLSTFLLPSILCPGARGTLYRRHSLWEWKCIRWGLEWVLLKDCRPWLIVFPAGSQDVYGLIDFGLLSALLLLPSQLSWQEDVSHNPHPCHHPPPIPLSPCKSQRTPRKE